MKNFFKAHLAPVIGIIALVAVIGFSMAACSSDDDDDGSDGSGGGAVKINWLLAHTKNYTVTTDGVADDVSSEYDVTYTSYTDDKHYAYQYSYTAPQNTTAEYESFTYTTTGSQQYSYKVSRDGNTSQATTHSIYDITSTYTYKDSSLSSNNSTGKYTQDITTTSTVEYDNDSGLQKSYSYQQTGTTTQTNNGTTTTTPININSQQSYTIELLSTEGSAKTYKSYVSSATTNSNGTSTNLDVSTQGYTVYKIQNGITLETKSYTAEGALSYTQTSSFPDNATIRSKLPNYTLYNYTSSGDGYSYTGYSTVEVVSDSNTELRILYKYYSNGKLSSQSEETYRPR